MISILKVKPTGFAMKSTVGCERQKGLKCDAKAGVFTKMGSKDRF